MSENESAVPRSKPVKVVTRMTKEQKEILERYYNEGMKSKSKDSLVLQTAAAAECELPLHIVLVRPTIMPCHIPYVRIHIIYKLNTCTYVYTYQGIGLYICTVELRQKELW